MPKNLINCVTPSALLNVFLVCIFYNDATSTKLKRNPRIGYIIVKYILLSRAQPLGG
jgi:hypothetical protein